MLVVGSGVEVILGVVASEVEVLVVMVGSVVVLIVVVVGLGVEVVMLVRLGVEVLMVDVVLKVVGTTVVVDGYSFIRKKFLLG